MEVKEYFDIMPKLYDEFPDVPKTVIKYIIKTGFYVFRKMLSNGFSISSSVANINIRQSLRTRIKKRKLRNNILYIQKKKNFKNEYYFSVYKDNKEEHVIQNKSGYVLKNIYCSKEIKSVINLETYEVYALELTDVGMDFYIDELKTDRVRLIKYRNKNNKLINV